MYYVTAIQQRKESYEQTNVEELLRQMYNGDTITPQPDAIQLNYLETITFKQREDQRNSPLHMTLRSSIDVLAIECKSFLDTHNVNEQYETFYIPKHSGGYREINSPLPEIKELQYKIVKFLKKDCKVLTHNSAFAYVEKRSAKHALEVHQKNQSRWFLKLDLKDFFPSCTLEFMITQLKLIYPLCFLPEAELSQILSVCCLNGSLPQGAPTSPLITNLLMVPFDYTITSRLYNFNTSHFVYTRYADDLLISNAYTFKWQDVVGEVQTVLEELQMPFTIKQEKTRYGSANGRNWNLGLMYNKDLNITVGHKRKERTRAALHNFFRDYANGTGSMWSIPQTQILLGEISYLNHIEPNYIPGLITKYESKFNLDFKYMVKYILNN